MSEPKYMNLEPDINQVQHIEELDSILEKAGVNKEEVIIYGSSPMALYGIKENDDLEFIPHPKARRKFIELDREDTRMNAAQIIFPNKIRSVYLEDRMARFGWSDEDLFENEDYFIEHEGYKFMKLELMVSLYAAKRRPKDLKKIQMLEEKGLIGGEGWDWNLVHHLPPWERPERPSKNLLQIGRDSIKQYGLTHTLTNGPQYVVQYSLSKALEKIDTKNQAVRSKINDIEEKSRPYIKRKEQFSIPELLNKQFNEEGEFERYDLIATILYLEGEEGFEEFLETKGKISVTPHGRLNSGLSELASIIASNSKSDQGLADEEIPVRVSTKNPIPAKTYNWAEEELDKNQLMRIEERKDELLDSSGSFFYAMLWPSVRQYHDEIENWLNERIDVVDTIDVDLGDKICDFLESVYAVDNRPDDWEKERKIVKIQSFGSKVRILKIRARDPDFWYENGEPISGKIHSLKQECRKEFQDKLERYEYGVITHFTDNYKHNVHNSKVVSKYRP